MLLISEQINANIWHTLKCPSWGNVFPLFLVTTDNQTFGSFLKYWVRLQAHPDIGKSASQQNLSHTVTKVTKILYSCFRLLTVGKMQLILLPTLNFSSIPGHKNESSVNIRTCNLAHLMVITIYCNNAQAVLAIYAKK